MNCSLIEMDLVISNESVDNEWSLGEYLYQKIFVKIILINVHSIFLYRKLDHIIFL